MSKAVCQDVLGELSCSLSGMRKEVRNWEKKWRQVFINHKPKSSTFVCCRDRELCGFVHDHVIIGGYSVQLTCIESRLKERLDFRRRADLSVDDGDGSTVTILNRLVRTRRILRSSS